MNDTRGMNRRHRVSVRMAVVLCLLLAIGVVPMAAFGAPVTVSDVEATYLNSATINLDGTAGSTTSSQLDGGAESSDGSVTTSKYGAHVLKFWSTDGTGGENTITAPFFVDEDVKPIVVCDIEDPEGTTVEVDLEATDNFNGSGVDFLCYRVDGGKIQTAMAPASLNAAKVLFARIAKIKTGIVVAAAPPSITPTTPVPADHYDGPCSTCHEVIIPTPEPTSTPDPTGTPAPDGGVVCEIEVTGVGSHTVEYWAQDIARNATSHVVETFEIARIATGITLKAADTTIKRNQYASLSSVLSGGVPAGSHVRYEVRRPGRSSYSVITSSRDVSATGKSSQKYKVTSKGSYYFRVRFMGLTDFAPATSKTVKVSVR
jgi:hypothetical protein